MPKATITKVKPEKVRFGHVKSVQLDAIFKQKPKKNPYIKSKTELKKPAKVWEYHNEY